MKGRWYGESDCIIVALLCSTHAVSIHSPEIQIDSLGFRARVQGDQFRVIYHVSSVIPGHGLKVEPDRDSSWDRRRSWIGHVPEYVHEEVYRVSKRQDSGSFKVIMGLGKL
jgi:hypothetical protein